MPLPRRHAPVASAGTNVVALALLILPVLLGLAVDGDANPVPVIVLALVAVIAMQSAAGRSTMGSGAGCSGSCRSSIPMPHLQDTARGMFIHTAESGGGMAWRLLQQMASALEAGGLDAAQSQSDPRRAHARD